VTTGVTSRWCIVAAPLLASLMACGGSGGSIEASGRIADVPVTPGVGQASAEHTVATPRSNAAVSLARAAAGAADRPYRVVVQATSGFIVGKIGGGQPLDTSITPTHDRSVCRPFTQSLVPSRAGGVGNSVVWLAGVTQGPRDDAPRRVRVLLDGCRLEPRVQRVAAGGTVMLTSRDAMMTRLQFLDIDGGSVLRGTVSRGTVLFNDAGQVVPSSEAAQRPGLVLIRDDLHPWVRGYLAVTPHPFVAVTAADGLFRFDNVPPGRYTLVVWHERFGTTQQRIRVDAQVETRVALSF
jgi:hypothetical protein